jgi:cytochrome c-type biogenesis protein CcmF
MINTWIGDMGHLFVIISFIASAFAAFSFFKGAQATDLQQQEHWKQNGRVAFVIHFVSVLGIIISLFYIIANHLFEYHYAWSHSSRNLPTHYMISCFWEGQEGSFLLWIFWHALLGLIVIRTNKKWEAPVMTIFSLVQAFLGSMILGVIIFDVKIGSSPFILLRDALDAPIFALDPNFVPEDGTGLNPLLQNYWMVIHPPTLFLGFATTLIPFAYAIAGLWKKEYKSWIRPALPWSIFAAAVLGLGILMGGYWAYETLTFGGYWNWDPVENAVYVPWIVLVAGIHTMIAFKKSNTALKASIILVIATFILILYSTFLTRSGILGDSSAHSFTDLGLSGQLLIYMLAFLVLSILLAIVRWKEIPSTAEETSAYSREFWIFMGATTLCLMGFQVIVPTSIPVFNAIVEAFGGISNMAPPADQVGFYTKWQMWFAIALALFSGTGQFFWWKKMDAESLKNAIMMPIMISVVLSALIIVVSGIYVIPYMLIIIASIYSIVANGKILISVLKSNYTLAGGSIAHIGVAMMLIGILYSSGYSKVVSLNTSGLLYAKDAPDEINRESVMLWINEPRQMKDYILTYSGQFVESEDVKGYIKKDMLKQTDDPYRAVLKNNLERNGKIKHQKGDTIHIYPENTYYKIEYTNPNGKNFTLYPRAQVNPTMGLLSSPDVRRTTWVDLYTHVSMIADPEQEIEWSKAEERELRPGERFFVNDFVAELKSLQQVTELEDFELREGDLAVQAEVIIYDKNKTYNLKSVYLIRNNMAGRISDETNDLGVKLSLIGINPEAGTVSMALQTAQRDYVIMKALEKPLINVLWIGTLVLMLGFVIAIYRRYTEFMKMRDKALE